MLKPTPYRCRDGAWNAVVGHVSPDLRPVDSQTQSERGLPSALTEEPNAGLL